MSSDSDDLPTAAGGPRARAADTIVDEPLSQRSDVSDAPDVDAKPRELDEVGYDRRYDIKRELGAGGMGVVNLCVDTTIGREVAVKVMPDDLTQRRSARNRFLREARVQAQLEHPGVVPVYDLGVTPSGKPYFSMKRVRGTTLKAVFDALAAGDEAAAERYPRRKLLSVVERVCETMAYAHSRGVVHRDLKPANIMLGDFGEVSVLDWGIAKLRTDTDLSEPTTGEDDLVPQYTVPGSVVGTAGYMSPEQASGQEVDARADVYVLGAILFEAIALEPLHPGSAQERTRSTLSGTADPRPSARTDEEVPPELDAICERACARKPRERYADASGLLADLRRFLDGARVTELRREVATQHAEAARVSLAQVSASETVRVAALRELGAAAVLDPDNPEMVKMIESLLAPEPHDAKIGSDVREALQEGRRELAAAAAGRSSLAYLAAMLCVPIFLWMGVRHWPLVIALGTLLGITSLGAAVMWRTRNATGPFALASVPFAFVTLSLLGGLFGPFFLVPGLASTTAVAFIVSVRAGFVTRLVIYVCACLSVLLPYGLELAGVLPQSYRFDADGLTLLPHIAAFPELPTTVLLIFASLFVVLIPSTLVGRAVEELRRAEVRQVTLTQRLRSLLPSTRRAT